MGSVESVLCFPSSLWESVFFTDFHSCGTFHSLFRAAVRRFTLSVKVRDGVRPVTNAQSAIQVFVNRNAASGQGGPKARRRDLQYSIAELDRIVVGDDPVVMD